MRKSNLDFTQISRIEKLTEEFYHEENKMFFCAPHPAWCFLCFSNGKEKVLPSFEWLIYHLDCEHDEDIETILLFEETVLRLILGYKHDWEKSYGRYSN